MRAMIRDAAVLGKTAGRASVAGSSSCRASIQANQA
jgi:hypothetical protein